MTNIQLVVYHLLIIYQICQGYRPKPPTLITFWGQNTAFNSIGSTEKSLANLCGEKSPYTTIVIGYVSRFFDDRNKDLLPGMGFSFHCNKATDDSHPALLYCPRIASDIRFCHEHERKILIGIGGPNSPSDFETSNDAEKFAKVVWNLFLGGEDMPDLRPFGSVVLDGINVYMEDRNSQHMNVFLRTLHELRQADLSKTYKLTVSPSCMFPDPYFGPGSNTILEDTINLVDQVYIRYMDRGCCVRGSNSFRNSLSKWKNFMSMPRGAEFYMAIPAAPEATTVESCYRSPQQMEIVYNSLKWRRRFKGFCIMDNSFDLRDRQAGFVFSNNLLYYILPSAIRIRYVPVEVPIVIKIPITQPPTQRPGTTTEPLVTTTPSTTTTTTTTSTTSTDAPDTTESPDPDDNTTEAPSTVPPATDPPATESPATDPPATESPATDPPATQSPATDPPATEPPTIATTTTTTENPVNVPTQAAEVIPNTDTTETPKVTAPIQEQKASADDLMEINGQDNAGSDTAKQDKEEGEIAQAGEEVNEKEEQDEAVEDQEDQGEVETEEQEKEDGVKVKDDAKDGTQNEELVHPSKKQESAQAAEDYENKNDDRENEDEDEDEATPDPVPIDDKKLMIKKKHKKQKKRAKKHSKFLQQNKGQGQDERKTRHSYRQEIDSRDLPGILGSKFQGSDYLNQIRKEHFANDNQKQRFWSNRYQLLQGSKPIKINQIKNVETISGDEDESSTVEEEFVIDSNSYDHNAKASDYDDFSASGSSDQNDEVVYFYPYDGNKVHAAYARSSYEPGSKKQNEMSVPNVSNPYGIAKPPLRHEDQFDENRKYLDMLQDGMKKQTDQFNQDIINQQPMDPNKVDKTKKYPYPVPDEELQRYNGYTIYPQQRDLLGNMDVKGNMDHLKSLMSEMDKNVKAANSAIQEKQKNDQEELITAKEKKKGKGKEQKNFFEKVLKDFRV